MLFRSGAHGRVWGDGERRDEIDAAVETREEGHGDSPPVPSIMTQVDEAASSALHPVARVTTCRITGTLSEAFICVIDPLPHPEIDA